MYQTQLLARPCRNFCILSAEAFTDPKDGLPKLAVVSFVNFAHGVLYLIEPRSNTAESYELPADNGAWALHNHADRCLIIGTCAEGAYIHRFDLRTRRFDEPVQAEGETYVFDLVDGGDGYLYGGTYNGCRFLQYDPEKHALKDLGRVGDNPRNLYSRNTRVIPGYVAIDAIRDAPETWVYRQADGRFMPLEALGETLDFTHARMKTDTKRAVLADGSTVRIDGQEYEFTEPGGETRRQRLPGEPPATGILGLCGDGKDMLWGTTNFGMTFFGYNTRTGAYTNTGNAVPAGGGEFYGACMAGGKLYLTSYSDGYHLEYDPNLPWDVRGGSNPRILARIAPDYIRPCAFTVAGPRGALWTGWLAPYGTYGGALSRIDPSDGSVHIFPVGDRGVVSVAADDERIYYATNGRGNGLPKGDGPFKLASVDPDGNEFVSVQLPAGIEPTCVYTDALTDKLVLCSETDCTIRRKDTLEAVGELPLRNCQCIVRWDDTLIAFAGNEIFELDAGMRHCRAVAGTEDFVRRAWTQGNAVYFGVGTGLWKLTR